jgi:glyoxylase I family protein
MNISKIHHVAIICSNYEVSKHFYTHILGFSIIAENYREERDSYKLDLAINGTYAIELFSFPNPAMRPSKPEGTGLRHLAFQVDNLDSTISWLAENRVQAEPVRIDEFTGSRFTFIADPDDLPIEFYEILPL